MKERELMQDTFLNGPGVRRRYSISNPTLWRWQRDLNFPPPAVRPNTRVRLWKVADLEAWENSRSEAQVA